MLSGALLLSGITGQLGALVTGEAKYQRDMKVLMLFWL
jgi:hypothetical protein